MSSSLLYSDSYGEVCKCKKDGRIYLTKIIKSNNLKYKDKLDTLNAVKNLTLNSNQNLSEFIDFYFNDNGDFEILMEYDEGSEFEAKVKYNLDNHRTFEEDYIWSLTIQILNLVKFIQQNKKIKVDINPSKILLMDNGKLKIFDYGMDLISNMGLSSSISISTDYTTPPELMKDEVKTISEDAINIWKAGCIIYELLTLHHVFEFESMFDMQMKLSQLKGVFNMNIDSRYSNDFKELLSKMLVAEPEKRATVDQLLNSDIIKRKNNDKLEHEKLEKKLIKASIFSFKQSILKSSFKDSLRQVQNQNEMMENDNYEILKFSLSNKNSEIENINTNESSEGINYLKQTAFFGGGGDAEREVKQSLRKEDFKELLLAEKLRKENEEIRIIDNIDYSYNNPFRSQKNDIIEEKNEIANANNNKEDIKESLNNYKENNNYYYRNDLPENTHEVKNDFKENKYAYKINNDEYNKIALQNNNRDIKKGMNYKLKADNPSLKEREKKVILTGKNKKYFVDDKFKNTQKNDNILPKLNNRHSQPNVDISKELNRKNNFNFDNMNNNNLVKKTEQVMNLFNPKNNKNNHGNKFNRPFNNNNLASMTNAQIDEILNKILHKQNVQLVNKIQKKSNIFNLNKTNNKKNINNLNRQTENKVKLKGTPQGIPSQNVNNIENKEKKKIKISYGTIDYKNLKGKKPKLYVKK